MDMSHAIWFALAFTLYAGWLDWRTRRIPNWLTLSGFVAGLILNSVFGGWHGTKLSMEGTGLALGLLLPLVLLRGLGAGDWKLMGAVGALMGWQPMLFVLVVSILIAGAMAIVQMALTRRVKQTFGNLLALAKGFITFGVRPNPEISLDNPILLKLPFGVAVAAATLFSFIRIQWLLR